MKNQEKNIGKFLLITLIFAVAFRPFVVTINNSLSESGVALSSESFVTASLASGDQNNTTRLSADSFIHSVAKETVNFEALIPKISKAKAPSGLGNRFKVFSVVRFISPPNFRPGVSRFYQTFLMPK